MFLIIISPPKHLLNLTHNNYVNFYVALSSSFINHTKTSLMQSSKQLLLLPSLQKMVTVESVNKAASVPIEPPHSSPRISFSSDFLDDNKFITISPSSHASHRKELEKERQKEMAPWNTDFEFLSSNVSSHNTMLTADELFFEGKLLPFWQMQQADKLNKMSLKVKDEEEKVAKEQDSRLNWFIDDDPSPRPPKCTILWKELLRLKKQRGGSSLSPSSSSSSSSSLADIAATAAGQNKEKQVKRIKKGLERTRSASIRIRPMINVPICAQVKSSAFPPLFPLKKGRTLDRSENNSRTNN